MLDHYIKFIWRSLRKNKMYSFINIFGLSTGMAVVLLITLWVLDEVSFNHSFKNHERIAQVFVNQQSQDEFSTTGNNAVPVGDALAKGYPSDFEQVSFVSGGSGMPVAFGDKKLNPQARFVEAPFTSMFSLDMLEGNRNALNDPLTVLLSGSMADALFGKEPATGKIVRLNNTREMKVGGVYKDFPHNTVFYETRVLVPWNEPDNETPRHLEWNNHSSSLYVQLKKNIDIRNTIVKIRSIPTPHITQWHEELTLQPLDDVHLYDKFVKGEPLTGRIQFVWMFGTIALFVLLIACINFMNLSTARSEKRAKQVGVIKSLGAHKQQVMGQFLLESVTFAFISLIVALLMVQLALPYFNTLAEKQVQLRWASPWLWITAIGFSLLTGIIAGSYPAFYLSSFNPVTVLKGTFKAGREALLPRRIMVIVQFTVCISLMIGTAIVFRQLQFARSRPAGYSRQGLITTPLSAGVHSHLSALKNDLLSAGLIENMAASSQAPSYFYNNNSMDWPGKNPSLVTFFHDVNVTFDFGRTIGWTILNGRDFSADHPSDSNAAVINETAARIMNFHDPVGQVIKYGNQQFTIIGVVKDMITQSPYASMEPSVFFGSGWLNGLTLRLRSDKTTSESLAGIASVFEKYDPDYPFNYQFVDKEYGRKFSDEEKVGNLVGLFAVFTLVISCLGLFGLSAFVAEQRTKEIGLRKVLGASVLNVWQLLSKEFVLLTLISFFIAIPVSYYFMHNWLQNYEYRSGMPWWIFALAALLAMLITLFTISFQAIRAAIANPVKSLRSE